MPAATRSVRGWVAAAVTVVVAVAATLDKFYPERPDGALDVTVWAVLLVGTLVALALCFIRPGIGSAAAAAMLVLQRLVGQLDDWAYLALGIGLYAIMRSDRRRWPWLVTTGVALLVGGLTRLPALGPLDGAGEVISDFLAFAVVALFGELARRRRQRIAVLEQRAGDLDRLRELRSAAAVADERARMARELHDVLAHAVSAIVIQAGAGRRAVRQRPVDAETAFASIETTGRDALDDLRRMVGTAREGSGTSPQPSITNLDSLIRDSPVPVHVTISGSPAHLEPAVDLTAYRVIQESLTNVRKHAVDATRAHVCLRWSARAVEVSVGDDGRPGQAAPAATAGFGLIGMGERVALCGGKLDAGPQPSGNGWLVRASLPLVSSADPS